MKKPSIPTGEPTKAIAAIKANLDVITGRVGGELIALESTSTTAQIISKINEIIGRLNASN